MQGVSYREGRIYIFRSGSLTIASKVQYIYCVCMTVLYICAVSVQGPPFRSVESLSRSQSVRVTCRPQEQDATAKPTCKHSPPLPVRYAAHTQSAAHREGWARAWVQLLDDDGDPYYHNLSSGLTTWVMPGARSSL